MNELVREQIAKLSIWMPEGEMQRTIGADLADQIISLLSQGDEPPMLTDEEILNVSAPVGSIEYEKAFCKATLANFMPWHNATLEKREGEAINTAIGAYESTCEALIQEAKKQTREEIWHIIVLVARDRERNFGSQNGWLSDIKEKIKSKYTGGSDGTD